jgi:hypothetical protein
MTLRTTDRATLEALSRHPTPRAFAPDAMRARLGEADRVELQIRSRSRRGALRASVMLAILLCSPAVAHGVASSDVAHRCAAGVVERLFTQQLGGHVRVGAVDAIDAHRISLRDVTIEDPSNGTRLDLDAVELDYDATALFAGRLVSSSGIAKGGRLTHARAEAPDRDASARTDVVRLDRLETIDVAGMDEHALVRARVAEDGSVVVHPARL